jgi:hypothetical protein
MLEYNDKDIRNWMIAYHQVYETIGQWNNANLLSKNRSLDYMKNILNSAREIPENLVDVNLRKKLSILEEAVKIAEEKHESLGRI